MSLALAGDKKAGGETAKPLLECKSSAVSFVALAKKDAPKS